MTPHVIKGKNEKTHIVALPAKKFACVESTCPYVEIMEDRVLCDVTKKHVEIGHVFTCLCCIFLLSDMTDFR